MKYAVSLPITGFVYFEIEADNEEQAIAKCMESDITTNDIAEWGVHEHVIEGNVFHGMLNSIDVEEI